MFMFALHHKRRYGYSLDRIFVNYDLFCFQRPNIAFGYFVRATSHLCVAAMSPRLLGKSSGQRITKHVRQHALEIIFSAGKYFEDH